MNTLSSNEFMEHVFRHEYGKIVAILVQRYGPTKLEKIEDAVQDSLLKAMQLWAYKGRPDNPTAWLLRVSNNHLIDTLRRDKKNILLHDNQLLDKIVDFNQHDLSDNNINDSQLKMIFACCNPALNEQYQLILSLKLIGGFSNKEISNAILKKEQTIAKSYTRAKVIFRNNIKTLDIPIEMGLASRVHTVLKVIYLMYSEGYKASSGQSILKKDICFEAIRLALLLAGNHSTKNHDVHALIALMCFHTARFDARVDLKNRLIDLEHQDRKQYDQDLIAFGILHLEKASNKRDKDANAAYYYQAIIAYHYSSAKDFNTINWKRILEIYELQLKYYYSPIIELNSLVPYYKIYGAKKALNRLKAYENMSMAIKNSLYFSLKGELCKLMDDRDNAILALNKAIKLTENDMEKNYLIAKLGSL